MITHCRGFNKLKISNLLPHRVLCPVGLKLVQFFWKRKFRISPYTGIYSPYLDKIEPPFPKDAMCQVWVEINPEKRFFKFHYLRRVWLIVTR